MFIISRIVHWIEKILADDPHARDQSQISYASDLILCDLVARFPLRFLSATSASTIVKQFSIIPKVETELAINPFARSKSPEEFISKLTTHQLQTVDNAIVPWLTDYFTSDEFGNLFDEWLDYEENVGLSSSLLRTRTMMYFRAALATSPGELQDVASKKKSLKRKLYVKINTV